MVGRGVGPYVRCTIGQVGPYTPFLGLENSLREGEQTVKATSKDNFPEGNGALVGEAPSEPETSTPR